MEEKGSLGFRVGGKSVGPSGSRVFAMDKKGRVKVFEGCC